MKKIYLILFICIAFLGAKATTYSVNIVGGPGTYTFSPALTNCSVGDQVIIQAASFHPIAQVDGTTWAASGTTTMTGGWGSNTTTFTYTAVSTGTVYFICQFHLFKGMIIVNSVGINETAAAFLNNYNLFPNPAKSNVNVSFGLTEASSLNIKLFNIAGQEIKTFVSDLNLAMGNYQYNFDLPQGISDGNYFIEISSGNRKTTKKLLVSK